MKGIEIVNLPVAHTAMLIRRPISEVSEAIIDPRATAWPAFDGTCGPQLRFRWSGRYCSRSTDEAVASILKAPKSLRL